MLAFDVAVGGISDGKGSGKADDHKSLVPKHQDDATQQCGDFSLKLPVEPELSLFRAQASDLTGKAK